MERVIHNLQEFVVQLIWYKRHMIGTAKIIFREELSGASMSYLNPPANY